jgi:hypothetical protein
MITRIEDADIEILSDIAPMGMVREMNHLPWNKVKLSRSADITLDIVKNLYLPNAVSEWDWCYISYRVPIQDVIDNPNEPWNREYLSINSGMTTSVMKNLHLPNAIGEWDYDRKTCHEIIKQWKDKRNMPMTIKEAYTDIIFLF